MLPLLQAPVENSMLPLILLTGRLKIRGSHNPPCSVITRTAHKTQENALYYLLVYVKGTTQEQLSGKYA
jgi:hypothetical protein